MYVVRFRVVGIVLPRLPVGVPAPAGFFILGNDRRACSFQD